MKTIKKSCLNCKNYRLDDIHSGVCRVVKKADEAYPLKQNDDICDAWADCGQQYFIRKGWIKARVEAEKKTI